MALKNIPAKSKALDQKVRIVLMIIVIVMS
jgi:hypothetical protein